MEQKKEFKDVSYNGKCEVCGKHDKVVVVASALGPLSYACCEQCFTTGLEPIGTLAGYLAEAGIRNYEMLRKSSTRTLNYMESQMINRGATEHDWEDMWEAVNYTIDCLDKLSGKQDD